VYPAEDHVLSLGAALFLALAARGGHAVPAGALPAAPHAIAAAPVRLAAVFAAAALAVIPLTRTVARARRTASAG
jgi:hypothetical protein